MNGSNRAGPWAAMVVALVGVPSAAHASDAQCFVATGSAGLDAQVIRQRAAQMGWKVDNATSLVAAGVAKGKVHLYPQGSTQVCLRMDEAHELAIQIQASSSDAGHAEWKKLPATRT